MKKKLLIIIIPIILFSCKSEKDYTNQLNSKLIKWTNSTKNLDYKSYKKMVKNVKSADQFNEIYRDYYFENPILIEYIIVEQTEKSIVFEVKLLLNSVVRKTMDTSEIVGMVLVEYDIEEKEYLIKDHVFIRK